MTPEGASGVAATRTRAAPALVKALARAFRWKRLLEDGRYASISDIAVAEKIDRGYVGTILRLTLLAPDIVEAILNGPPPGGVGLPALLEPFPMEWDQQRTHGFVVVERRKANADPTAARNEITTSASPLSDQYRGKRRLTPAQHHDGGGQCSPVSARRSPQPKLRLSKVNRRCEL
jgi:hypothetical protein